MTLLNNAKTISIFCLLLLMCSLKIKAQDLYDPGHTKRFAYYLFKTKQYDLAAQEYERAVFLDTTDLSLKTYLVQSYRFSGNFNKGIESVKHLYKQNLAVMPYPVAIEYIKLNFLKDDLVSLSQYLSVNKTVPDTEKNNYLLGAMLLSKDWGHALLFVQRNTGINPKLVSVTEKYNELNYKSPAIAMGLSAIVPGLGKVYAKSWKDGLVSLIFVGTNSWQAYRGFHRYGIKSAYGWIFGGIAFGFYTGNVYGSYKAAKKYNLRIENNICNEAKSIIYSDF
jgi:hypothetical protein